MNTQSKLALRGTPERLEIARQSRLFRSMQLLGGKAGKPANDRVRQVIAREIRKQTPEATK